MVDMLNDGAALLQNLLELRFGGSCVAVRQIRQRWFSGLFAICRVSAAIVSLSAEIWSA